MMGTQTEVDSSLGHGIHDAGDRRRVLEDLSPSLTVSARHAVGREEREQLKELLVDLPLFDGVHVTPDPKRNGFFDLSHGGRTFYFYVYPSRRHVMLLAVWRSGPE